MKVQISDKKKKETFVSLFQVLKNCSSLINATFESEHIHIQGMDKSHVCLFDIKINKKWFSEYNIGKTIKLCFDTNVFHSIISTKSDNQDLIFKTDSGEDAETLHIHFVSQETKKGDFKKFFKMPLVEYEYEELNIIQHNIFNFKKVFGIYVRLEDPAQRVVRFTNVSGIVVIFVYDILRCFKATNSFGIIVTCEYGISRYCKFIN